MTKKSHKITNTILLVITAIFLVAGVVGLFVLPQYVNVLIDQPDKVGDRENITQLGRAVVHIMSYVILLIAICADCFLMSLFIRVGKGELFTSKGVFCVNAIMWCCFALTLASASLLYYFQMALVVTVGSLIIGICLILVRNAVEEAMAIKNENDLTV